MPLISDSTTTTTSAIKPISGYHQRSDSVDSAMALMKIPSSPGLSMKSAARDNFLLRSSKSDDAEMASASSVNVVVPRSFEFREDPDFWKEHNVQVIIRVRPLSSSEISLQGHNRCVKQDSSQSITWIGHPESRFTFDIVADEHVSQEMLFKVAGVPMVENCMEGYNSCMFAYGQTGSGKTHTMLGDIEGGTRRHSVNCGMTPRVFEYLFSRIQKDKDARREEKLKFTCRCSFLEIYNEQILDLLNPSSANLQIREDTKKGVYVENLTEVEVTSARDVIHQLIQGSANRKVAATNMNRASSRSHSVFTCIVESKWEFKGVTHYRFARLNLVDLAGSERQKSSGAEGERLKEATNINKSLSTLGLVIMNLVSMSNGKSLHVPYRDSKLTFLLQDSLGGNAKTCIIANISPASCCSLETLSTLKFAQRAKFIKNHAIVNEDASGDVLALRLENQNLKKELSRLRSLANGGVENNGGDDLSVTFPRSPGSFKWDGFRGFASPLVSDKKMSHLKKKEYEVALVGAFKREKDKDTALQALAAEKEAAVQLAKQREDEIQGLKMRLRFREAGLKRLEAVASGKISAEVHLLKEKEEHLKEIEVLRAQVDRNQEVTRFAMENLRLEEDIRRFKSFCEEGERESMSEQIMILQNKLLEALDWKLMHESDPSNIQKQSPEDNFLNSNQETASPWRTTTNEENEFLRMQAIHNQSELDLLRKKLDFCVDEKEKLERQVNDLAKELEAERLSKEAIVERAQNGENALPSLMNDQFLNIGQNDQREIKTMVEAIAAASQREAEAHEMAIFLSKENEELRMKLKVLIDDNNKLIDLYERAASDNNSKNSCDVSLNPKEDSVEAEEKELEMKREIEGLKRHLTEMHEENDKLLSLYEKAMQERDEFKKVIASGPHKNVGDKRDISCPEKLVEIDAVGSLDFSEASLSIDEPYVQNVDNALNTEDEMQSLENLLDKTHLHDVHEQDCQTDTSNAIDDKVGIDGSNLQNDYHAVDLVDNVKSFTESLHDVHEQDCHTDTSNAIDDKVGIDGSYLQNDYQAVDLVDNAKSFNESLLDKTHFLMHVQDFSGDEVGTDGPHVQNDNGDLDLEDNATPFDEDLLDGTQLRNVLVQDSHINNMNPAEGINLKTQHEWPSTIPISVSKDLNSVRKKLAEAQENLSHSAETITTFGSLERAIIEVDAVSEKIAKLGYSIEAKNQELEYHQSLSSQLEERKEVANKKLLAVKFSLMSFSSSFSYFEQREALARTRLNDASQHLVQRREKITRLLVSKQELVDALLLFKQSETELKSSLEILTSKMEEENRKLESDRVLFAIDNVEKTASWQTKATDLLKSEEEKTKLQNEIKLKREKLGDVRKETEVVKVQLSKMDNEIQDLEMELQKEVVSVKELNQKVQSIVREKEMLMEVNENGRNEFENLIVDYYQCLFEAGLKQEELKLMKEELVSALREMEGLDEEKDDAERRKKELLEALSWDKVEAEFSSVRTSVVELSSLLECCGSMEC